jgi:hypothetical protein
VRAWLRLHDRCLPWRPDSTALADPALQGTVTYEQFESLLGELHKLGFFPETELVSAVVRTFV